MRADCGIRRMLAKRAAIGAWLATVIIFSGSVSGIAQESEGTPSLKSIQRVKRETINRVRQYPDIAIEFVNFEAVPLAIQSANVKEIGNSEFLGLTGFTTSSSRYTSFPNVVLTNNTDQRVTGLVLVVGNKQTRKIHGVSFNKIAIDPHGTFAVASRDWVRPERSMRIAEDGRVTKRLKPGLDSDKMWCPGAARDMVLRIGMVVFENGSRWTIDRDMDPW
ncbi:MAG TPA: hypothetical protein VJH03_19420 [Blastocatellia bacterium]|nr:hypothetical protein [Blastocatellia bacterium]